MSLPITTLDARQRELLQHMQLDAHGVARFTSSERVPDWAKLKKVMVALGGTWKGGKVAGFVFPEDADIDMVLTTAKATGEIVNPSDLGYFPTPGPLADRLVSLLKPSKGASVLEPSAGQGSIVQALQRLRLDLAITAVELLPRNARALGAIVPVIEGDFLTMPFDEKFDHVAMNPPFARGVDIRHVNKALDLVRSGGSLAAIMSAGIGFREDKLTKAFRARIENIGGFEPLPQGSFVESRTHVNTCLLWIPEVP